MPPGVPDVARHAKVKGKRLLSCVRVLFQPVRVRRFVAGVARRHNLARGINAGVWWRRSLVAHKEDSDEMIGLGVSEELAPID